MKSYEGNNRTKINCMRRINLIRNQLNLNKLTRVGDKYNTIAGFKSKVNPLDKYKENCKINKDELKTIYFPFAGQREFRDKMFTLFKSHPEFRTNPYQTEMTSSEMKELLAKQMKILINEVETYTGLSFKEIRRDPIKFGFFMESINHFDFALSVRFAVHSILYYNSLVFLGTEKHSIFIERSLSLEDIGCFALTELGHGSNVRNLKTTAHYCEATGEFILNTPSYEAYKWWIGGAGRTSNMAIIFAQLYTKGINYGVHAFLVPIRDKGDHMPYPGVILGDTGPKAGNEAVDNGFIAFNNYRISRDSLLDKFSSVGQDGSFTSSIPNSDTRFATALGALSEGRYACLRPQFSVDLDGKGEEQSIIEYPTTQVRLLPTLAEIFAIRAAGYDLGLRWVNILPFVTETKNPKVMETHAIISALKAYSSWTTQTRIQQLREVMGGHGYSRFNMIGSYRNNNDINTTWEGDNTVLSQQTAKFILDNFKNKMKGKDPTKEYTTLMFLNRLDNDNQNPEIKSAIDLDNLDLLKSIFEYRVGFLLQKTVSKLAERVQEKNDALLVAWNNSQVYYIQSLVKAYIENFVFNSFRTQIEKAPEGNTKSTLVKLLKLYSLTVFDSDWAILRNDNFIDSDSVYIIKDEILELCRILKDDLITILDCIAPDDEVLNAPMGRSDGKIWESYLSRIFSFNQCYERPSWWENLHHKKIKGSY